MPVTLSTSPNPLQSRLESISMRLDAAADTLLQTRDLLIRHLEHQMLQIQEVRTALHQAAREAEASVPAATVPSAVESSVSGAGPVKPHGGLDLDALFAPLNALQRPAPATPGATPPDASAPGLVSEVPLVSAEVLFDAEPSPAASWESDMRDVFQGTQEPARDLDAVAPGLANGTAVGRMAGVQLDSAPMGASSHEIDPALEKATLDELNEALTRAFAQIATRQAAH